MKSYNFSLPEKTEVKPATISKLAAILILHQTISRLGSYEAKCLIDNNFSDTVDIGAVEFGRFLNQAIKTL